MTDEELRAHLDEIDRRASYMQGSNRSALTHALELRKLVEQLEAEVALDAPGPEPEPPADEPTEPAPDDFTLLTRKPWADHNEAGWRYEPREGTEHALMVDPDAPFEGGRFCRITWPVGASGNGAGAGIWWTPIPDRPRRLRLVFWARRDPAWVSHPTSGVNKDALARMDDGSDWYAISRGDALDMHLIYQHKGPTEWGDWWMPPSEYPEVADASEWRQHVVEIDARAGRERVRLWTDGILVADESGHGPMSGTHFVELKLDAIYGGRWEHPDGSPVLMDWTQWVDYGPLEVWTAP